MPTALPLAVLLAALPGPSRASAAEPVSWGLMLGAMDAQGDFRQVMGSRLAFEAGLSAGIPLGSTTTLRPILEFQRFPALENGYSYRSTRYTDLGSEQERWSAWSFGADALFRPAGMSLPLYFVAGGHLKLWRLHSYGSFSSTDKVNGTRAYAVDDTDTRNEPALALGMGCTFSRHWALETRMVFANYRKQAYNTLHFRLVLTL